MLTWPVPRGARRSHRSRLPRRPRCARGGSPAVRSHGREEKRAVGNHAARPILFWLSASLGSEWLGTEPGAQGRDAPASVPSCPELDGTWNRAAGARLARTDRRFGTPHGEPSDRIIRPTPDPALRRSSRFRPVCPSSMRASGHARPQLPTPPAVPAVTPRGDERGRFPRGVRTRNYRRGVWDVGGCRSRAAGRRRLGLIRSPVAASRRPKPYRSAVRKRGAPRSCRPRRGRLAAASLARIRR